MGVNDHGSCSDSSRHSSSSEFSVPTDESGRENTLWNNCDPKMWEGSPLLLVDVFGERLQDVDVWNY
jgi:hypothetical protein